MLKKTLGKLLRKLTTACLQQDDHRGKTHSANKQNGTVTHVKAQLSTVKETQSIIKILFWIKKYLYTINQVSDWYPRFINHSKLNNNKNPVIIFTNGARGWKDIFPKKTYTWLTYRWKKCSLSCMMRKWNQNKIEVSRIWECRITESLDCQWWWICGGKYLFIVLFTVGGTGSASVENEIVYSPSFPLSLSYTIR